MPNVKTKSSVLLTTSDIYNLCPPMGTTDRTTLSCDCTDDMQPAHAVVRSHHGHMTCRWPCICNNQLNVECHHDVVLTLVGAGADVNIATSVGLCSYTSTCTH